MAAFHRFRSAVAQGQSDLLLPVQKVLLDGSHLSRWTDPADSNARRWACDTGFREIKAYLRGSMRALRGTGPDTAWLELWACLIVYQALRLIICQAALAADLDPAPSPAAIATTPAMPMHAPS